MADNVQLPATGTGTADVIAATDKIGGVDYQRIKVDWGPDGTATDVDKTAAAALPVQSVGTGTNASSQVTVTNSSTTIIAARAGRRGVLVLNKQTVAVAIDSSGGTAVYATHFVLDPGAAMFLSVTNAITGITSAAYTATGDAKLHLVELF